MEPKELKSYIAFLFISLMFLVNIITCTVIFISYRSVLESTQGPEYNKYFEINLPVIEWGKYDNLSKKLPDDSIRQVK